ncbi:MAG: hypothetical protein HY011_18980 [Acidobacteria bacterium]|nr:hypothetical protein [Acidobacteriota bacterium]
MKATDITKREAKHTLNGQADAPAAGTPSFQPTPFPYAPKAEEMRPLYERVAATFSNLYELQFDYDDPLLQIDSPMQVHPTDFVGLIDKHMHDLFDEVNLADRRVMAWLYPHLRLIVDTQKVERETAKEKADLLTAPARREV